MRFWLTLILGTVLISAGMTWLVMHQGQEILPSVASTISTKDEPPLLAFILDKGQSVEANVVVVEMGESKVDTTYESRVRFANKGKGPLRLSYLQESCGCIEVKIDGKPFTKDSPPVVKKPNEEGLVQVSWKPTIKHYEVQPGQGGFRFSFDMKSNDPRFNAAIKVEIKTEIQRPPKGK